MDKLSLAKERELIALATKHGRRRTGKTIVEGTRAVETLLHAGPSPEYFVFCRQNLTEEGRKFCAHLETRQLTAFECDPKRFAKISDTMHSQGILAVVRPPSWELDDQTLAGVKFILFLDGISDPGNVGTIVRTAAAYAVDLIAASPDTADFYNPKAIRSSAGTVFGVRVLWLEDSSAFFERLFANKIDMIGTAPEADADLETAAVPQRACLAIGSEARGLSPLTRQVCRKLFRLRTVAGAESLNAAAAAAIAIHHIAMKLELI